MAKQSYFNILLDILQTESALELCKEFYETPGAKRLFFINAHCFNIAQKDEEYLSILNASDLVLNDGSGIKLGSLIAGLKLQENMNGTDFIPKLISQAKSRGKSVFLLGATKENILLAKQHIEDRFGSNLISGFHHGFFKRETSPEIVREINESGASLLIVGMGVPYQEKWISQHMSKLDNIKIAVAGGAILDFLSGNIKRAPRFMQILGIEWIFRLWNEPRRLMKRYLIGNFVFLWSAIRMRLFK